MTTVFFNINVLFRTFYTIFGSTLLAVINPKAVQSTTYNVITDTRQVTNTTTFYQNNRVFLQVVSDAGDIGGHLDPGGQTDPGNFTQG